MEVLDPKQGKSKSKEIKKRDEVIQYIKIDLPPEALKVNRIPYIIGEDT
uniref:Uncharacterized protein n=2 Tax=Setaria italica TaxID=4555 RepID=K3Z1R5_SETIT